MLPSSELRTPFISNIKRHGQSAAHDKALMIAGYDTKRSCEELASHGCPSIAMFKDALANRLRRDSLQSGLLPSGDSANKCGKEKLCNLQFCLGEAARARTREALRDAATLSVMQDGRHGDLLMRYCAVDAALSVRRGVLGCVNIEYAETITNIVQAMHEAVRQACCVGYGGPNPEDDRDLQRSVCQKVTMFVADAAANEQGAGRVCKMIFPNVISCQKDRAHACMRVLKRPWDAIGSMSGVLEAYVFGSDSIIQKIHHSKVLQDVFSGFAQQLDAGWQKRIRHLKAAKHRFASCTQPLQRMVVYLDAIISTLVWVSTQRDGADKAAALDFLEAMNEKDLVLMAMMSDLADETSQLLRMVDTESYDLSEFPAEVETLVSKMHHLVNKGNIFHQGFTAHMIQALERPRGFMVPWWVKWFPNVLELFSHNIPKEITFIFFSGSMLLESGQRGSKNFGRKESSRLPDVTKLR